MSCSFAVTHFEFAFEIHAAESTAAMSVLDCHQHHMELSVHVLPNM
jgi:hypothetical protein